VPAVQIFSGMHGDYHRPSDTPDKVSAAGLVKVASFLKEAVTYMLEREPPLTIRINAQGAGSTAPATSGNDSRRKVLFGAVPAFDYQGPGVKLESVVPESPAAVAGLKAGDILVRIDKDTIGDLQTFSNVLKKLQADQTVVAVIRRDGKEQSIKVTLKKR
jgi:S1-C subfamily serine protease